MLLVSPWVSADSARLGRLFTTPAQRAALEAADPLPHVPAAQGLTRTSEHSIEYTGFIRTPAGVRRWINGAPGAVSTASGSELEVPEAERPVKVGERVDLESGAVRERWRARAGG